MKIKINKKEIEAREGETILEVAKREGIKIPFLCNHPDICVTGSCRICIVEVKGKERYISACSTKVEEGMEIETKTKGVEKVRRMNLELLFSQHKEECDDCVWNPGCKLLSLAREYGVEINRFEDRKDHYPDLRFGEAIDFQSSKCIDCRNCVEACDEQNVSFLKMEEKNDYYEVNPDKDRGCVYCGQCIIHCPAGSFESVGEFEGVAKLMDENNDKEIVFQIAPSVRVSIGEEFKMETGVAQTGKLVSALKEIGADAVYDVSFAADLTTIEESNELVERLKEDKLPLFTSCCPAWVRFVELYYPEFIENIATTRSPQIISGGVIKEFSKDPENTVVVSVMPCTAKKHEIKREELTLKNGRVPVDYVLTVREVGWLLRRKGVDFPNLKESSFDNPFGEVSADAVGYGVSGGVMEAAVRHVFATVEDKEICERIKEREEFDTSVAGNKIRTKKVSGLGNSAKVLEELKEDPHRYDYVEFMACPDGCIGGGGQPIPTSREINKIRRKGLLEEAEKGKHCFTFQNESVKKIHKELKDRRDLFHTHYSKKDGPQEITEI